MSSILRGMEGILLDRALQLIHPLRSEGLRMVLPVYDGVLLQVPENKAEVLAEEVRAAFARTLFEAGVVAQVSTAVRPTWA